MQSNVPDVNVEFKGEWFHKLTQKLVSHLEAGIAVQGTEELSFSLDLTLASVLRCVILFRAKIQLLFKVSHH